MWLTANTHRFLLQLRQRIEGPEPLEQNVLYHHVLG
jgi:hypothetical protein